MNKIAHYSVDLLIVNDAHKTGRYRSVLQCVAMCCSALQCII